MREYVPSVQEIATLTQRQLAAPREYDSIRDCGRAALELLPRDPGLCLKLAYQKLHDVPYKDVKTCWRRLYTDASLWKVVQLVEESSNGENQDMRSDEPQQDGGAGSKDWVDEVVRLLDMALILTSAPEREGLVEMWFSALKVSLSVREATESIVHLDISGQRAKRRKTVSSRRKSGMTPRFATDLLDPQPTLRHPIPREINLSFETFEARLDDVATHTPLIIGGAIQHWPAHTERLWNEPGYLLEQTLGGRRLVPVEIGKSYTDDAWGQRIITFRDFLQTYMLEAPSSENQHPNMTDKTTQTGYLAQHDLFAQIPSLRTDISIPDYCFCEPAPSPEFPHIKPVELLDDPVLNAWFGPAGTVSPLHTDPYHNILAQVVGYKYVRLYAPDQTDKLYPRGCDDNGVDMSNTSLVDLDEAMAVWPEMSSWEGARRDDDVCMGDGDERVREFEERYPMFREAKYVEGILGPGECLYLPVGWWHYVRSLTPSFSVSFWFN